MSDGKRPDRVHIIRDADIESVNGNGIEAHETADIARVRVKVTNGTGIVLGGVGSTLTGATVMGNAAADSQPKRGRVGETAASVAAAVTAAAIAKAMGLN